MSRQQDGPPAGPPPKPGKPADLKTPGMLYRPRQNGWVLLWSPRSDLVERGYSKTTLRLWPHSTEPLPEPTRAEWEEISAACERRQSEMLAWANGSSTADLRAAFNGTIRSLSAIYQTDEDSPFKNLRYVQRGHYTRRLRTIEGDIGSIRLLDITFRDIRRWYEEWAAPVDAKDTRHEPRAYDLIAQLRLLFKFGKLALPKSSGCRELCEVLEELEFKGGTGRRKVWMSYQQAMALCAKAHDQGWHSIALAQALMIECAIRQKDVIGEWVPRSEPGITDVFCGPRKWIMGARWEEIDSHMVWRHRLSKSVRGNDAIMDPEAGQQEEYDLFAYPIVLAELRAMTASPHVSRSEFPATGPIIVCETTRRPWSRAEFGVRWRQAARAAGIPDNVQNRDSRPGAATEAILAGADKEMTQKLMGHARGETTDIYIRGKREIRSQIAELRSKVRERVANGH